VPFKGTLTFVLVIVLGDFSDCDCVLKTVKSIVGFDFFLKTILFEEFVSHGVLRGLLSCDVS